VQIFIKNFGQQQLYN